MFDEDLVDLNKFKDVYLLEKEPENTIEKMLGESKFIYNTKDIENIFQLTKTKSCLLKPMLYGSYAIIDYIILNKFCKINKKTTICIIDHQLDKIEAFNDLYHEKYGDKSIESNVHSFIIKPIDQKSNEEYIKKMHTFFTKQGLQFTPYDYNEFPTKSKENKYKIVYLANVANPILNDECETMWRSPEFNSYRGSLANIDNNLFDNVINSLNCLEKDGSFIIELPGITNKYTLSIIQSLIGCFEKYDIDMTNIFSRKHRWFKITFILTKYNGKNLNKEYVKSQAIKATKHNLPDYMKNKTTCDKFPIDAFIDLDKDFMTKIRNYNAWCLDEYLTLLDASDTIPLKTIEFCQRYNLELITNKKKEIKNNNKYIFAPISIHFEALPEVKKFIYIKKINCPKFLTEMNIRYLNVGVLFQKRNIVDYEKTKRLVKIFKPEFREYISNTIGEYRNNKPIIQSWLKMWEILKIFPELVKEKNLKTFHLAEAPGGFIWAIEYYCKINNIKFTWKAQTLENDMEDLFGMQKNNPDKWQYGDITDGNKLQEYKKHKVDLITNDAGVDWLSADKLYVQRLQYSILLSAVMMNTKNSVIKLMISYASCPAIASLIMLCRQMYKKVYMYKPLQNEFSPEIYLIMINKKETLSEKHEKQLLDVLKNFDPEYSVFDITDSDKSFFVPIMKYLETFIYHCRRNILYLDYYNDLDETDKKKIETYRDIKMKEWKKIFL